MDDASGSVRARSALPPRRDRAWRTRDAGDHLARQLHDAQGLRRRFLGRSVPGVDRLRKEADVGEGQNAFRPAIQTCSMLLVLRMLSSGLAPRINRSAAAPGASVPNSPAFLWQRAASPVADTSACIGVSPASTIISSSRCSKNPWNRAGGPVSVPNAMRTPLSASVFRFFFATSRPALYCWPAFHALLLRTCS